jgi:hypothetical protein
MAEVIPKTGQEFWQPPSPVLAAELVVRETTPSMAEVCLSCGTEFLLGSRFCHSCGRRRPEALSALDKAHAAEIAGLWEHAVGSVRAAVSDLHHTWNRIKFPAWMRYLAFHEIQRWVGLPTASLIAFIIGLACISGALLVGLLTARTLAEWQAIQFYRAEWLLGATAAFVAGILLKNSSNRNTDNNHDHDE